MRETIRFVINKETRRKILELIEKGYRYICIGCRTVYKEKGQEFVEDGHGGHDMDMCRCGSDLFEELENIRWLDVKVKPVRKTLVFKEHHAKYCKCEVGEIWTGKTETECRADFRLLKEKSNKKIFKCLRSGLKIVILKSTEGELKNPDERGSTYISIPEEVRI